jgi:hypothetical protein
MKRSMDDLTNQAIDLVLENDALHERVVKPLKQKVFPYALSITIFNLILFILVVHLVRRLSILQTSLHQIGKLSPP